MTQDEIFEYNKMCAEFLGWKETSEQFKIDWIGCKTKERLEKINKDYIPILEKDGEVIFPDFAVMDFSRDWNRIMEILLKIQSLPLDEHTHTIWNLKFRDSKETVIRAINQFLIWYNENNT